MRAVLRRWVAATSTAAVACGVATIAAPASARPTGESRAAGVSGSLPAGVSEACPQSPGPVACASLVDTGTAPVSAGALAAASATPSGYGPSDLRSAYRAPAASGGAGQTVAVVTAYDDPTAEPDLATYRSQYGLTACTSAGGCFMKTDQRGGSSYPAAQPGWSAATAQSLDMISALCPNCHLLLVEADSAAITDVGAAENTAASLGARFIDNTYYTPESTFGAAETGYDANYFNHPGVAITAPAGNSGYGVNYPAASQYVTAVGGTTLTKTGTGARGWAETAWPGSGSGCSAYEPKPSWQTDTGCGGRTLNDVAAVADPFSPVAFYDTATGGWVTGGGTTVSAAIAAAVYALAGTPATGSYPASYPYNHPAGLNDITAGTNGTCTPSYLCAASGGYDGPTGLGSPDSIASFNSTGAGNPTDVLLYRPSDGAFHLEFADGSGGWTSVSEPALAAGWNVYPGDLNGDGRTDVFLYRPSDGASYVLLANGSGGWGWVPGPAWSPNWTVHLGDFNGDGRSDVLLYRPSDGATHLEFADGRGGWNSVAGPTWSASWNVYLGAFG